MSDRVDRFAVFAGETYYAGGGASNLIGWAVSEDEAWLLVDARGKQQSYDWCHALDVYTGEVVRRPGWLATGHGDVENALINWKGRG